MNQVIQRLPLLLVMVLSTLLSLQISAQELAHPGGNFETTNSYITGSSIEKTSSYVELGILKDTAPFEVGSTKVTLEVEELDEQSNVTNTSELILTVYNNRINAQDLLKDKVVRAYTSYGLRVEVKTIEYRSGSTVSSANPGNIYIKVWNDNEVLVPLATTGFSSFGVAQDGANNELVFVWEPIQGAEYYEIEWTWVDDYKAPDKTGTPVYYEPSAIKFTEQDFKHNSTRVQVKGDLAYNRYTISNTYDNGYFIGRIRGVGRYTDGPDKGKLKYTPWNTDGTAKTTLNDWAKVKLDKHSGSTKNWQFQSSFAEEGKKKEVLSYFDGSLRNRQTVTKINSDDKAIVGEVIYDAQGRPAVEVLPVPVSNKAIRYYDNFNKNEAGAVYSYKDFDIDGTDANAKCNNPLSGMSTMSGASQYYSSNVRATQEGDYQDFVPDALGYPFSQIEYTPDNTGRIKRKGGVGKTHQLDGGHEMKYYYTTPDSTELKRLFGANNYGNYKHYKKNIVIDPNKQASVSYIDAQGRTVATALLGDPQDNLVALEDASNSDLHKKVTSNILNNRLESTYEPANIATSLVSTKEVIALKEGEVFTFDYAINQAEKFQPEECTLSFPYVYDFNFSIKNECGEELYLEANANQTFDFSAVASGSDDFTLNDLKIGNYSVTKRLTVQQASLNNFADQYMAQFTDPAGACYVNPNDFAPEVSLKGCLDVCHLCLLDYGIDMVIFSADGTPMSVSEYKNSQDIFVISRLNSTYGVGNSYNFRYEGSEFKWDGNTLDVFEVKQHELWAIQDFNEGYSYEYTQAQYKDAQQRYTIEQLAIYFDVAASNFSYTGDTLQINSTIDIDVNLANGLNATYHQEFSEGVKACEAPCDTYGLEFEGCGVSAIQLLSDMSPRGQYGVYEGEGNESYDNEEGYLEVTAPLSIFNIANSLPNDGTVKSWRTPDGGYKDEDGSRSKIELVLFNGKLTPEYTGNYFEEGGKKYIYPEQLADVLDFIDYWQGSWAKALLKYHPEYEYYLYKKRECENALTTELTIFDPARTVHQKKELNSDQYDSYISQIESYANAVEAGLFTNEIDLLALDPYFKSSDVSEQKAIMEYAINIMYEYMGGRHDTNLSTLTNGPKVYNMLEAASLAILSNGLSQNDDINGDYIFTMNHLTGTTVEPYGIVLAPSQKNKIWQTYRSYYLSLKAKVKDVFMHHALAQKNRYNGCIGKELDESIRRYNSVFKKTIKFKVRKKVWWWYVTVERQAEVTFYPTVPEYIENSSAFCASNETAWVDKQARFVSIDNLYDSSQDTEEIIEEHQEDGNYHNYAETGKCPLAHDLEYYLNGLVNDTASNPANFNGGGETVLNVISDLQGSNLAYRGQYISNNLLENIGGVIGDDINLGSSINGTELVLTVQDLAICKLSLPSDLNWNDYDVLTSNGWNILGMENLYYSHYVTDSSNITTFYFKVLARIRDGQKIREVVLDGSTAAAIGECTINQNEDPSDTVGVVGEDLGSGGDYHIDLSCNECKTSQGSDADNDKVDDGCDNCINNYNPSQVDSDGDKIGNVCDNCPDVFNPNQVDLNNNGIGDACEGGDDVVICEGASGKDDDNDGIDNTCDNCPRTYNPKQLDSDGDGIGDACESSGNCTADINKVNTFTNELREVLNKALSGFSRDPSSRQGEDTFFSSLTDSFFNAYATNDSYTFTNEEYHVLSGTNVIGVFPTFWDSTNPPSLTPNIVVHFSEATLPGYNTIDTIDNLEFVEIGSVVNQNNFGFYYTNNADTSNGQNYFGNLTYTNYAGEQHTIKVEISLSHHNNLGTLDVVENLCEILGGGNATVIPECIITPNNITIVDNYLKEIINDVVAHPTLESGSYNGYYPPTDNDLLSTSFNNFRTEFNLGESYNNRCGINYHNSSIDSQGRLKNFALYYYPENITFSDKYYISFSTNTNSASSDLDWLNISSVEELKFREIGSINNDGGYIATLVYNTKNGEVKTNEIRIIFHKNVAFIRDDGRQAYYGYSAPICKLVNKEDDVFNENSNRSSRSLVKEAFYETTLQFKDGKSIDILTVGKNNLYTGSSSKSITEEEYEEACDCIPQTVAPKSCTTEYVEFLTALGLTLEDTLSTNLLEPEGYTGNEGLPDDEKYRAIKQTNIVGYYLSDDFIDKIGSLNDSGNLINEGEEYFCNMNYAYIAEDYLYYIDTVLGEENNPLRTVDNDYFISLAEFGNTPFNYGYDQMKSIVDLYKSHLDNGGNQTWDKFTTDYYDANKKSICPPKAMAPTNTGDLPVREVCADLMQGLNDVYANENYLNYLAALRKEFVQGYTKKALASVEEKLTMEYSDKEYQYTLYYYDQAGNLLQTVPPEGVDRVTQNHKLKTEYVYNSLNQLVAQQTPDGGITRFAYDDLGRIIASQNAKQAADKYSPNSPGGGSSASRVAQAPGTTVTSTSNDLISPPPPPPGNASVGLFSYTLYDELGRITEAGQLRPEIGEYKTYFISGKGKLMTKDDGFYLPYKETAWFEEIKSKTEVTKTFYDLNPLADAGVIGQDNLRNRVAAVAYYADYTGDDNAYQNAIFYSYDIHGNVKQMATVINDAYLKTIEQHVKVVDYDYDLISGNVNTVTYQKDKRDQFIHKYNYDADNRIVNVATSKDGIIWDTDASYNYYEHGPLARTVIGDNEVQGVDYVYTLQGWLKSVNGESLDPSKDFGKDGLNNTRGKDAFGYSLNYFDGDYKARKADETAYLNITNNASLTHSTKNLYNGNIKSMVTNMHDLDNKAIATAYNHYSYDQLNRISAMNSNIIGNQEIKNINTSYTYDRNGNLTNLRRQGIRSNSTIVSMDNFEYKYDNSNNQLTLVKDAVHETMFTADLDDQEKELERLGITYKANDRNTHNYQYDEIGQLVADKTEGINTIRWTVAGKVSQIIKNLGNGKTRGISFAYDGLGNRISKRVYTTGEPTDITYYIRDAQGNVLAVYEQTLHNPANVDFKLKENHIYGSARLGIVSNELDLTDPNGGAVAENLYLNNETITGTVAEEAINDIVIANTAAYTVNATATGSYTAGNSIVLKPGVKIASGSSIHLSTSVALAAETPNNQYARVVGKKRYELSNHLGNVLSVISDRKIASYQNTTRHNTDFTSSKGTWKGSSSTQYAGLDNGRYKVSTGKNLNGANGYYHLTQGKTYSITVDVDKDEFSLPLEFSIWKGNSKKYSQFVKYSGKVTTTFTPDATRDYRLNFRLRETGYNGAAETFFIDNVNIVDETVQDVASLSFNPEIIAYNDYYPFGMLMPNRHGQADSYRYGFNGKEKDDEVKDTGAQYDYGFRIYDPRLGKFLSTDPLFKSYPWYTPYQFAGNKPINSIDLDGLEEYHYSLTIDRENGKTKLEFSHKVDIVKKVLVIDRQATQWMDPGDYHYEEVINPVQAVVFNVYDPSYGRNREKRKLLTTDYIQKNVSKIAEGAKKNGNGLSATGEFYAFGNTLDAYDFSAVLSSKVELSNREKDAVDSDFAMTILAELPIMRMFNSVSVIRKNISLGIAGPGWRKLNNFADDINAPNAMTWRKDGITSGNALNFADEFLEAIEAVVQSNGRIKFDLDDFDIQRALKNKGKDSYDVIDNVTNWEFNTIMSNPKLKKITDFYETIEGVRTKVSIDKKIKDLKL